MDKDHIVDANKKVLKNPVGAPAKMIGGKRRNIYIDEQSWELAKEIGKGKPSEGIRRAIKYFSIPDDRDEYGCIDPSKVDPNLPDLRKNVGKKITD